MVVHTLAKITNQNTIQSTKEKSILKEVTHNKSQIPLQDLNPEEVYPLPTSVVPDLEHLVKVAT